MSIPNLAAIRDWCLEKFSLNPATANDLGGIKVGSGLSVTQDGTLSTSGISRQVLYESGDVNAYASYETDVSLGSTLYDYDTLIIMFKWTDQTLASETVVIPYILDIYNHLALFPDPNNVSIVIPLAVDLTSHESRYVQFIIKNISSDYKFWYNTDTTVSDCIPGIRRIVGIRHC